MTVALQRTPLYDLHLAAGARLVEFGGWSMPVQYQGIVAEHQSVRSQVGMFDVSHMGKFELLGGDELLNSLQQLVPSNLARLQPGEAQYTVLLNSNAGIIDDVIFYWHGRERWSVIVNASTTAKDKDWLTQHIRGEIKDHSAERILLAVQGPQALAKLQEFVRLDLSKLKRFRHATAEIFGRISFIARTGYTGEDGFELMLDLDIGQRLWQELLEAGVTPCGLGCRDTLRLEAGLHLYGQDMDDSTTPIEADLSWLVHLAEKDNFMGRANVEKHVHGNLTRRLVALEMQGKHIARHGYQIVSNDEVVGIITSGSLSPTLGKPIALGYVPPQLAKLGQMVQVQIRDRLYEATVVKRPFYKPNRPSVELC